MKLFHTLRPIAVLGISFFALCGSSTAYAAISFCNRTSVALEAALGYREADESGGETWVSEGWWRIEPGQCARVIERGRSKTRARLAAFKKGW